jgi:hypothetical protein
MIATDYLLSPDGRDWAELLKGWSPPLPEGFTVWMANLFAHVFIVLDDSTVHMLDIDSGTLDHVADSREAFRDMLKHDDNFNQQFMAVLVDRCREAGIRLNPGQCYSLVIPAVLGGKYDIENIKPISMAEYYSFMASVHSQIKDLPDGSRVVLKIVD